MTLSSLKTWWQRVRNEETDLTFWSTFKERRPWNNGLSESPGSPDFATSLGRQIDNAAFSNRCKCPYCLFARWLNRFQWYLRWKFLNPGSTPSVYLCWHRKMSWKKDKNRNYTTETCRDCGCTILNPYSYPCMQGYKECSHCDKLK